MAPYICYIHGGLYVKGPDGVDGCHDEECLAFASKVVRPVGIHIAGFAGSTATKQSRVNSQKFHKDMYAFEDAVKQGVTPDMVTAEASETALKEAEASVG